jgi:hypothetical protein
MSECLTYHKDLIGADLHIPGYIQATDPGAVGAGKLWVDTSGGSGSWLTKVRNTTNTGWESVGGGGGGVSDGKVKISSNDSIANYLNGKLVAGTGITLTENNDGSNETLSVICSITQYTDALARAAISSIITGITYTPATGVFSLTSGYVIPTTTEESNWNTAYGWGNHAGLYSLLGHTHALDDLSDVFIGSGGPLHSQLLRYETGLGWHNWTPNYSTTDHSHTLSQYWTRDASVIYPTTITDNVLIGTVSTDSYLSMLYVVAKTYTIDDVVGASAIEVGTVGTYTTGHNVW